MKTIQIKRKKTKLKKKITWSHIMSNMKKKRINFNTTPKEKALLFCKSLISDNIHYILARRWGYYFESTH